MNVRASPAFDYLACIVVGVKIVGMKVEHGLFLQRDPEAEAASIARARADVAAGRVVDHATMTEWLKTWGTENERPMPSEWFK